MRLSFVAAVFAAAFFVTQARAEVEDSPATEAESVSPPDPSLGCPVADNGTSDVRRTKPLCGQPLKNCPAGGPQGNACTAKVPAPKTFPNCAALINVNAQFLHFGKCPNPNNPQAVHRVQLGFEVKNFKQCKIKVRAANKLRPVVASWQAADGTIENTRKAAKEFCRRLYNMDPAADEDDEAEGADGDGAADDE